VVETLLVLSLVTGVASQYAPGVMDRVVETRQRWDQIPADVSDYDVFVAVESCDLVGEERLIRREGTKEWETALITDCSGHTETSQWMWRNNIIVEVDYRTALRWDVVGYGVEVEVAEWTLKTLRYLPY
jgi:hypothetical protein